ncbi:MULTISPECIES: sugar phosphate isomerase/epimerase family protein [Priestia]|uniref:sugar phosphate isomerase/epimerase family protein n=1 Tax=Priestia TaxID=2800373 RepID=UPI0011270406|nr:MULTISPECIES: sugar phosphate isomerase/epimerase [Priestia]TPF16109.1 xylose isomerase [Priestia megaterium]TPF21563.1 xylose isomerase [Priestia megaterium]
MGEIPVGVQLYTLREETKKDFKGTLQKVAALGYQGVEFAGYEGYTAQEVRAWLMDLQLKPASSHIPLEQLESNLEQVIHYEQQVGNSHIVCPYLVPERQTEKGYYELIDSLNDIDTYCKKEGMSFSYHHHDFELKKLSTGKSALHTILEETEVNVELDIYWLTKAGEDPVEWMKHYQNRTPFIHLKDMTTDGEQFFAPLGTGGVDVKAVMHEGHRAGVKWWIVEQDQCIESPLSSIKTSLAYIK